MEQDAETSSPLQAITDTMQKITGAITGQTLEQRISEYTSVYSEILLGMHDQLRDAERENRTLRRENKEIRQRMESLERRIDEAAVGRRQGSSLGLAAFILSVLSFVGVTWLILKHIYG